jgi:hypothetical protein
MIQRRSRLRLSLKTCERLRVFRYVVGQKFQCHETMQAGVLGLVNNAHTTAAEFLDNAVMGDGLADERIEVWHVQHILSCAKWQVNERTRTVAAK